jgi:transcriptional regulator with XRE-family HTH domain
MRGAELRDLRQTRGLKAKELARMLEIGDSTISRYERGHSRIPKSVEYATRWLCRDPALETSGERLLKALREALGHARG